MQRTFGNAKDLGKREQTSREIFLAEMEQLFLWKQLLALIEPHYPVSGRPGGSRTHWRRCCGFIDMKTLIGADVDAVAGDRTAVGYTKVRYRGLARNVAQVLTLFALSNLSMVRQQSLPARGSCCRAVG